MMISAKGFCPAASWTYKRDSERLEDHDFCNWLQEFKYAVRSEDQMMMEYCESELMRMFREKRAGTRRRATDSGREKARPLPDSLG